MSVSVEGISKIYDTQRAVDDISFQARPGEILGFLGPNGAGKTTTMKMITGVIHPSEGRINVCGFDTIESPIDIKEKVGYLPENNPLYLDMYVREYLKYVANIYKLDQSASRVEEAVNVTGLQAEQHKKIEALSKGYRQRVGIAQAIMHNPEVLILDEPTAGLDPNQLVEIRQLIRELGREKTLIFSTHIMQEVQALCDRVLIINKGRIVADGSIEMLQQQIGVDHIIYVEFLQKPDIRELRDIEGVAYAGVKGKGFELHSQSEHSVREHVFDYAVSSGNKLIEMHAMDASIEDVFHQLTIETKKS